jgi:hypothetical protein
MKAQIMKALILSIVLSCSALAQCTITITSPTAGAVWTGYTGNTAKVSITGCPNVTFVQYQVDDQELPDGITIQTAKSGYSVPINTSGWYNGQHEIKAFALDALGSVIATATPVDFRNDNTWPVASHPVLTVSPGTPITSPWSGSVTINVSFTTGDTQTPRFFIDGTPMPAYQANTYGWAWVVDTTLLKNGPHTISVTTGDNTTLTTYSCAYAGANDQPVDNSGEWTRLVQVSNAGTPASLKMNAREVFLTPGATFPLSGTIVNGDGTTSPASSIKYYVKSGNCTLSGNVVTAVASYGGCYIVASQGVGPTYTDLSYDSPTFSYLSPSFPVVAQMVGQSLYITGGTGFTPGAYQITKVDLHNPSFEYIYLDHFAGSATGGIFQLGLTSVVWIGVATSNIMPHFGNDGSILTTYDPNKSFMPYSGFFSSSPMLTGDQKYTPGYLYDYIHSGQNTIETGMVGAPGGTGYSTINTFINDQTNYVSNTNSMLAGTNLRLSLTGDTLIRNGPDFYNSVQGPLGINRLTGTQSLVAAAFQSWTNNTAHPVLLNVIQDEVTSSWNAMPTQGPIMFHSGGTTTVQSPMTSITSDMAGTCTIHGAPGFNGANRFIIHGSMFSYVNSVPGSGVTYGPVTLATPNATFPCSGWPPAMTWNFANDPGLTIEPYAFAWCHFDCNAPGNSNSAVATDYLPYTGPAFVRQQADTIVGRPPMTFAPPGLAGPVSVNTWSGDNTYFGAQNVLGVTRMGDYCELYGYGTTWGFLGSRWSYPQNQFNQYGDLVRDRYGYCDPTRPLSVLIATANANYSIMPNNSTPVATCTGDKVTFSAPHGLVNIIPNFTRFWVNGSSGCDDYFYVMSLPSPTTATVAKAVFATGGSAIRANGGTIHWANGGTDTIYSGAPGYYGAPCPVDSVVYGICAMGSIQCPQGAGGTGQVCGDPTINLASVVMNLNKHRGEKFTITGATDVSTSMPATAINSATYIFPVMNPFITDPVSQFPDGLSHFVALQIPNLSSTGGSAWIIPDANDIPGRNADLASIAQANLGFFGVIDLAIARAIGGRHYLMMQVYPTAWNSYAAIGGPVAVPYTVGFGSGCNQDIQLGDSPHWEIDNSASIFWGASTAEHLIDSMKEYVLQPAQTTPDYGRSVDTAWRKSTTYGDLFMTLNVVNSPQTITYDLTPFQHSGQSIIKYDVTYQGIKTTILPPGTTSDSVSLDEAESIFYKAPISYKAPAFPKIQVSLADQPNAAKSVVYYAIDDWWLRKGVNPRYSVECTNGCQIPVDLAIGTIYYRVQYLDINGKPLGDPGDMQQVSIQ